MTLFVMSELTALIGRSHYPVASWEQLSLAYRAAISATGLGAHDTPRCVVVDGGSRVIAYVSYNGRVWLGHPDDWSEDRTPIYDPVPPLPA